MGRHFEVRKVAMEKTAAAKSKVFSRFGREIYMAAKLGVPDPELNDNLKRIIEKAKKEQVSGDLIKRAIDKAKGGSGENYSEIMYEAYGPGNVALIISCLSDNSSRTFTNVRTIVGKSGGKIGVSGSVVHNFERWSILSFKGHKEDEILDLLLSNDIDVDEIETGEEGELIVYGTPSNYNAIRSCLSNNIKNISFDVDEISYLPVTNCEVDKVMWERIEKLLNILDEDDDVQNVYHNGVLKE